MKIWDSVYLCLRLFMPTSLYLTAHQPAKWARLTRSSIRSILLVLDIEDGCQHFIRYQWLTCETLFYWESISSAKTESDLVLISGHLPASSVVNTVEEEVQENVPHGNECLVKNTKYNVIACPVCQALKPKNCPAFPQTIIPVQKWRKICRMSFVKTTLSK